MSDFTWIALIIIVYMVVIRPMIQGIVQKPTGKPSQNKTEAKKTPASEKNNSNNPDNDYVDYEEVK
ncbi:MAG: hypothetical protein H7Y00_12410 [Fimbriimonadaceae bacterium]|nr:hypothetical protein [Chitinophagales bacterium]